MIAENKIPQNLTNSFIFERKLNVSIAFTAQSYFKVPRDKFKQYKIIYAITPNKTETFKTVFIKSFFKYLFKRLHCENKIDMLKLLCLVVILYNIGETWKI